jgi:glycine dehydrogenase subunit 2
MLTNPNTCGIFEPQIVEIAKALHAVGAYFYCDGANFNAIVGKVRPGDLGIDAMHINLHKTFSTPHGGGGPGAGPVVLSERLADFAPVPFLRAVIPGRGKAASPEPMNTEGRAKTAGAPAGHSQTPVVMGSGLSPSASPGMTLVEHFSHAAGAEKPFGRMCAFHGQMGMYVRALAYMLSHGTDGCRQASEDAVLSANYIRAGLSDLMSVSYPDHPAMHEALFDDAWLKDTGITTLDFAKAMIDEGYHPMTMYFPLVVHGAMLIEPTESESKASLDLFVASLRDLAMAAKRGDAARFSGAPYHAPRRRLDETKAARNPVLRWTPPKPIVAQAVE